jgi:hypothetical protein
LIWELVFPKVWYAKGFQQIHGRKEITKNYLLVGMK